MPRKHLCLAGPLWLSEVPTDCVVFHLLLPYGQLDAHGHGAVSKCHCSVGHVAFGPQGSESLPF